MRFRCPQCEIESTLNFGDEPTIHCPICGEDLSKDSVQKDAESETVFFEPERHQEEDLGIEGELLETIPPLTKIGRYRVIKRVAQGGYGTVYKASNDGLDTTVAIKIPRGDRFNAQEQVDAFVKEARTLEKLEHPNIVRVRDIELDEEQRPFIVMKWVEGKTLKSILQTGPLSEEKTNQIIEQVCDALAYAHKNLFVHRDLKPDNIMIDSNGKVCVMDFGLALHEDQQNARQGEFAGTYAYMSPEQIHGDVRQLDGRTDLWSLGVIWYECITGRRPFVATNRKDLQSLILKRDARPPSQLASSVSPKIEECILRCLSKEISQRPSSAHSIIETIEQWRSPNVDTNSAGPSSVRSTSIASTSAENLPFGDSSSNSSLALQDALTTERKSSVLRKFAIPIFLMFVALVAIAAFSANSMFNIGSKPKGVRSASFDPFEQEPELVFVKSVDSVNPKYDEDRREFTVISHGFGFFKICEWQKNAEFLMEIRPESGDCRFGLYFGRKSFENEKNSVLSFVGASIQPKRIGKAIIEVEPVRTNFELDQNGAVKFILDNAVGPSKEIPFATKQIRISVRIREGKISAFDVEGGDFQNITDSIEAEIGRGKHDREFGIFVASGTITFRNARINVLPEKTRKAINNEH